MSTKTEIATAIQNGITITADAATVAAPIVSLYNPAAGAALATLAPVVKSFVLSQNQILLNINADMTTDEMIAALKASKSANWGISSLETPKES